MQLQTERDKVAHLLRRFALGASETELDHYGGNGLSGAIDKLLDYDDVPSGFDLPIINLKPENAAQIPMPLVVAHWIMRLLVTRRPLEEKLTIFWHDHFATSAQKVVQSPLMYHQIDTLRQGALGSFQELLRNVSKDPAMLFWLDNQYNVVGKPNENFAREVMELFTLGIGHYSEKDVQEAARAFTGWSFMRRRPTEDADGFRGADFLFRPRLHDSGDKTIFGKTAKFTGEQVLELLCQNPQTAKYVTEKMWAWFAYPNPDPALVEKLSATFIRSGLSIKSLVRAIMEAPEFYSAKAVRKVVKNPVDFVIVTMRQLGYGQALSEYILRAPTQGAPLGTRMFAGAAGQAMQAMGMQLLFPPDVNGWESGTAWITSATMVERIGWADRIFGQATRGTRRVQVQNQAAYPLFANDPSPAGISKKLCSIFDVTLSPEKMKSLEAAATAEMKGRLTQQNANLVASKVTRLIFGSPEFQFC